MTEYNRGDVVWVWLDPTFGAEIKKERPCVILSITVLNQKRETVVVIPLASSGSVHAPLVIAVPSIGKESNARIDQIRTIDKKRISRKLGALTDEEMHQIEQAISVVLGV